MYILPRVVSTSNELRHCLEDIMLFNERPDKPINKAKCAITAIVY